MLSERELTDLRADLKSTLMVAQAVILRRGTVSDGQGGRQDDVLTYVGPDANSPVRATAGAFACNIAPATRDAAEAENAGAVRGVDRFLVTLPATTTAGLELDVKHGDSIEVTTRAGKTDELVRVFRITGILSNRGLPLVTRLEVELTEGRDAAP